MKTKNKLELTWIGKNERKKRKDNDRRTGRY